jgi:hypothetical protein
MTSVRKFFTPLLFAFVGCLLAGWAHADPPARVARLAYVTGDASFSPGGERDWVRAVVNRPLVTGDRLWVDRGARAELQLGSAAIRAGGATSLALLNVDDRTVQMELTQGTLSIRVRRLDRGETFEIDTPNLAFSIRRPGRYRIEVDPNGDATLVAVRSGLAEVYGEGRAFVIGERLTYRFYGSGLTDYDTFAVVPADALERWSDERDRRWDGAVSRRYVAPDVIGYEDLDQYGTWRKVDAYGFVWIPNRVPAGWAPYREGHWAWVEPWGWTWVDAAPWGFAPSHYGRWAYVDRTWAWVPGPTTARAVYAPALVAFVGTGGARGGGGDRAIAWFPLAPREVYRPAYAASREYFTNVNISNTVVNRTAVTNLYGNSRPANVTYANQQLPGAMIAVLAAVFSQSKPVAKETINVTREMAASAPAMAVPPVAPVRASVVGAAPAASAKPPQPAQARPVVAQVAPPPPPVPFEARQSALAANPGKPLDAAATAALKPAPSASAPAPAVKVVQPTKPAAPPPAKPASAAASARPPAARAPASAPAPAPAASPPPAARAAPAAASAPAAPPRPALAPPRTAPAASAPAPASGPEAAQPGARPASAEAATPAPATPRRPMPEAARPPAFAAPRASAPAPAVSPPPAAASRAARASAPAAPASEAPAAPAAPRRAPPAVSVPSGAPTGEAPSPGARPMGRAANERPETGEARQGGQAPPEARPRAAASERAQPRQLEAPASAPAAAAPRVPPVPPRAAAAAPAAAPRAAPSASAASAQQRDERAQPRERAASARREAASERAGERQPGDEGARRRP